MRLWIPGLLLSIVVPAALAAQAPLPLKHAARPTTVSITPADLMTRLYIYSDDSLMGRQGGTEYNLKATAYIAAEAQRMGLVPAGENGTWFQDIPLSRTTIDSTSTLSGGGITLAVFDDFLPRPSGGNARSIDGAAGRVRRHLGRSGSPCRRPDRRQARHRRGPGPVGPRSAEWCAHQSTARTVSRGGRDRPDRAGEHSVTVRFPPPASVAQYGARYGQW